MKVMIEKSEEYEYFMDRPRSYSRFVYEVPDELFKEYEEIEQKREAMQTKILSIVMDQKPIAISDSKVKK
ncbi:hypothetical protein L0152_07410 [bacterium]|nr:hypothetical protein [bacterium]